MGFSAYNKRRFQGEKPVKEGETYEVEVIGVGSKGDGVGKVQGFVVIIPNAKPGQKVSVRINAVRGKVAFGELVSEAAVTEEAGQTAEAEETEADTAVEDQQAEPEAAETAEEAPVAAEEKPKKAKKARKKGKK